MAKPLTWEGHRRATVTGLALFPCVGGAAAALLWQNGALGACAYYALLLAGLCSTEGAALCRAALGRKRIGPLVAALDAEIAPLIFRR